MSMRLRRFLTIRTPPGHATLRNMATVLVMMGLLLSFAGAVATATALVPRKFLSDPKVQAVRRDTLEISRKARKRGYEAPPYTAELVAEKHAEADKLYAEESAALENEIIKAGYMDNRRQERRTLWGILLVALGSVLQGAAALLASV